ncbi:MAG: efflux RND transporter permease subunit [Myxococcota bacterium]
MNLPKFAVRRPVLTTMVFLGVLILGAVSFTRLQVDLLPEIDFPSISVVTTYDGAGPEEVETLITRPVEQAVSTVEGIDSIESFSTEGRSRVALRFVWGTNLDTALNDVRAAIERVKSNLPEDAENPVVYKFNLSSFPVVYLGLSGNLDEPALRQLAERELGPRIERIEGVARVDVRGGLKREIRIQLNSERLRALSLSPTTIVQALRTQNRNVPAGQVEQFDENILLRAIGEADEPSDFENIVVDVRVGEDGTRTPIFLGDVAKVMDTYEEPSNVVRVNGKPGIRLSVSKQSGSNTVAVADRVIDELKYINQDYDERARLYVLEDTSEYIEKSISNVQDSVLIGALLAIFVLFFFLRNIRSTAIIATAIPISIIGIFTLMYYFGITLNLISFGGVALGIGLLVDNAIVILENIFRRLESGDDPETAAVEGSGEVATAIVASTTTTLVVFVPVIFLTGFASIFFGQMAFVVSFALICSLAVALTLVPMLSAKFLKGEGATLTDERGVIGSFLGKAERGYGNLVDWCLTHPKTTIAASVALLAGSLALTPLLGTELLPEEDQSEVSVSLDMPVGTRLEVTSEAARRLEEIAAEQIPEMETMRTTVGTPGFWSTSGEESASLEIKLTRPDQRQRSSEEIANDLRPHVSNLVAGADVRTRAGGGLWILRVLRGGGERLEVQIRGYDIEDADALAAQVKDAMEDIDGIASARASRQPGGKEFRIVPDRQKLGALGVTPDTLTNQLQTYVQGTRATVFRALGDEYYVLVQLGQKDREGIEAVLGAPFVLPGGGTVPMHEVVRVERDEGPLTVERENQRRIVTVNGNMTGDVDLGTVTAELRDELDQIEKPEGFSVLVKGEREEQQKTFQSLLIGILLAVVLVFMVMASQFESFLQPIYIMASIPFAAIGVVAMLVATGTTFNLQSFMGCIVLIGIVVNNAIVLIDYINLMRERDGMGVSEAVRLSARRRLRPILMTTATTILALSPVAIGLGEGGETQASLARAVIGGLFVSGGISLIIIPVIYNMVEGWRERRSDAAAR